ncbi:hypothetical protein [Halosimplex marinum]|uniref:hypothetical protein n=1 Tax=Halosimplex marinum TaxID=3396620 RepID=UPI003F5517B3
MADGLMGKIIVSVAVIVAAIPGLFVEPGPVSEVVALGVLAAIWLGDEDFSEVSGQI